MSTDNNLLKTLLLEAQDACRVKIAALDDTSAATQITATIENFSAKFRMDGIWARPITFDEVRLLQFIIAIRSLNNGDLAGLQAQVGQLAAFLENEVLPEPLDWLTQATTSDWNIKMLEALRKLRGTITRKKNALATAGSDPMDNAAFRKQDEIFNEQVEVYRDQLKEDVVSSDENDLKTVGFMDQMINSVSDVARFTESYNWLNIFLEKKIKPV
jgi:hypothetical protein